METNIFKNKQFKKKYPIELVPFNKEWLTWYEEEKNQLLYVLRDFSIKVYHIGSTAIPNIYSKNIIDIIIETNDNNSFDNIISILSKEWELRWKEDNRAFLVKGYGPNGFLTKVFHLHIRKKGDIDEVKFKEILLKNPEVARTYEKLKLKLEIKYKYDRESYTNGKTELINKIKKDYGLHKQFYVNHSLLIV